MNRKGFLAGFKPVSGTMPVLKVLPLINQARILKTWGWASKAEVVIINEKISAFAAIRHRAFVLIHPSDFDLSEAPRSIQKINFDAIFLTPIQQLHLTHILKVFRSALVAA